MNDRYKNFGTGAALIVAAAVSGFISFRSNRPAPTAFHTQAFYTTDDGATLFADSAELLPPFDHAVQQAVRAHVYTGDQGAHRWVQYLDRDGVGRAP